MYYVEWIEAHFGEPSKVGLGLEANDIEMDDVMDVVVRLQER